MLIQRTMLQCWRIKALFILVVAALFVTLAQAEQVTQAFAYPSDPLLIETPTLVSDAEAGSIGCVLASVTVGISMLYLMGGIAPALAFMSQPLPPGVVLEGSAALAFVFSSACYIGVAIAPITVSAYYNKVPSQLTRPASRPLFAPGELWAIGQNPNAVPQPMTQPVIQQPMAIPQQFMVIPQQHMAASQQQPKLMPQNQQQPTDTLPQQ